MEEPMLSYIDRVRGEIRANADHSWRERANCKGMNPDIFFPEKHTKGPNSNASQAKIVCAGCEVREECLEYAITAYEQDGVWGGKSPRDRKFLRNRGSRVA